MTPNTTATGPFASPKVKREYSAPALTSFGKLAALTNSASGCSDNDSAMCAGGGVMGEML